MATEPLDPVTGKLLWTARTGGMNASGRPLYGNGLIFINNGMGSLAPFLPSAVLNAKQMEHAPQHSQERISVQGRAPLHGGR